MDTFTFFAVLIPGRQVLGKSSIVRFVLWIEQKEDQIETREQRRRQLNVVDDGLRFVPLRFDRIGRSQNRCTRIQRTDDAGFGNGQRLLFLDEIEWLSTGTEAVVRTITSCRMDRALSLILSNSSIQQMPLSANTSAPLEEENVMPVV